METGFYSGASNLKALEGWQATIASNLANASTPGFRKMIFSIEGKPVAQAQQSGGSRGNETIPLGESRRSYVSGEIRNTGSPYDIAIQGEGMFALQGSNGEILYSRDGEFHRNRDGLLVSKQGYAVMGEGGPIQIPADQGPVSISTKGAVSQEGTVLGNLAIYEFDNIQGLFGASGSLFSDPDGQAGARVQENAGVLQGYLEGSNVSPLQEMVSLIQVSRAYETTQKLMQARDEMSGKAIESLGARS